MFKNLNILIFSVVVVCGMVGNSLEASGWWASDTEKNEASNAPAGETTDFKVTKKDLELSAFLKRPFKDWDDEPKGNVNLKKEQQVKKNLKIAAVYQSKKNNCICKPGK